MVCKEEVLLWFKDLDSYKRIDVLYELLNMCLPFELRFIGTCIEEIGKHTYQELRGPSLTANDLEKLSKDVSFSQGILDESVRHRVLVYLSLLSSRNYNVASWLYKTLLRTENIDDYLVKEKGKDELLHSEFLLLFTMALHHPAFTFEHKQFFSKVLETLINFRESRDSAKHCALGCPPGFGYSTQQLHDISSIPVRTAPNDSSNYQQLPGLSHLPPPSHMDFIAPIWNRPGYQFSSPPEMQQFPAPSISPLVSQAASPSQSRNVSPHRTHMGVRPPPPQPVQQQPVPNVAGSLPSVPLLNGPPPPIDVMPNQLPIDQLSNSSLLVFNNPDVKTTEEDIVKKLRSIPEENHVPWSQQAPTNPEVKPNGIRFPHFIGCVKPFLMEQMQALNVDGENSLHQSNSSSNSSPTETPPGTPANTPNLTQHGPGRGEAKARPNGIPHFRASPGPPIHNTASPPLPAPAFTNNSVPYSYSQPFTNLPPNRSMFHYTQTQGFRPTFTAHYANYPTDSSFPYSIPYIPVMLSSACMPRTLPGCYNCGAPNHVGSDCTSQNIEEITQKKTYQLEFASPLPDAEK